MYNDNKGTNSQATEVCLACDLFLSEQRPNWRFCVTNTDKCLKKRSSEFDYPAWFTIENTNKNLNNG